LSPYLFACYVDDIIYFLQASGLGCCYRGTPICVIMYADDILLIAPSVTALQEMLIICEQQLSLLEMQLNAKKSVCIRIGPRYEHVCSPLITISGNQLNWVQSCRYLGIYLLSARNFKCCFRNAKKSYFRSFNSIFGRVGRLASEEVVLKLIATKCVPIILYGLDACPVSASDKHSLDFVLTRCLMKLFNTGSINVIRECMDMFNIKNLSDSVNIRKSVFLNRYCKSANIVCRTFSDIARTEILSLGRLEF